MILDVKSQSQEKNICDIFGIKYIEVKPEYSSFVGNFLFRSLNLPDMCLAAFEIGRRTYEFIISIL